MPNKLAAFLEQKYKERIQKNYRYSVQAFARDLGVKRENLVGYMNPKITREPRIAHCATMAKALGLPLADFLAHTGLLSESEAAQLGGVSVQDIEDLPEAVRSAMATEDWVQLCPSPDEIEMVSRAGLKDAQSVLQAIRDFPWRKVKRLFKESAAPNDIQESCYRLCRALVYDWRQSLEKTGN